MDTHEIVYRTEEVQKTEKIEEKKKKLGLQDHAAVYVNESFYYLAQAVLELDKSASEGCRLYLMEGKGHPIPYEDLVFSYKNEQHALITATSLAPASMSDSQSSVLLTADLTVAQEIVDQITKIMRAQQVRDRKVRIWGGPSIKISRPYTWDHLCWPAGLKADVRDDVEFFLNRRDWFEKKNIPWKWGMILYGPPGNGKTMLVKVLLSQYDLTGFTFDFYEECATGGHFRGMFIRGSELGPALILLEDLDRALTSHRQGGQHDVKIGLDTLLNTLDGVGDHDGIFVIATANNLDGLDPALAQRPRRFDRSVCVPNPDSALRTQFLEQMFGQSISDELYSLLVERSEGFSMAFLEGIYIKSCSLAVTERKEDPGEEHVRRALDWLWQHRGSARDIRTGFGVAHSTDEDTPDVATPKSYKKVGVPRNKPAGFGNG